MSTQCQFFVLRKKRLCRMTVKPGKHYCGEHEPQLKTIEEQDDIRIPCPNDPKHTCYARKLKKHLKICNARQQEQPDYIIQNINAPKCTEEFLRLPLAKISLKKITKVINKVNDLYDRYLKDNIATLPDQPIHSAVLQEFNKIGRTESSLRHLRQASSLLHLIETEELVADDTCYVELGAGKGHLSYYAWWAWCQGTNSRVLLVDRASLRHKRDNKIRDLPRSHQEAKEQARQTSAACSVRRVRADLAHLVLSRVPGVDTCSVVGLAKHLCGVATDYALRCLAESGAVRGAALATCCQHRCERGSYVASRRLHELGINGDEFNTLLGVVSWATCGPGRGRAAPAVDHPAPGISDANDVLRNDCPMSGAGEGDRHCGPTETETPDFGTKNLTLSREQREEIGRRAKALLDWGRVLYLQEHGFDARLVYYVPSGVSLENMCIVAKKMS